MENREKAILYLTKLRDCKLNELKDPFLGREYGLAFVLTYLTCSNENATAKLLSEKMSVSMARMTTLIQKLEERGLIYREASKDDGRVSLLYLTDKGKQEGNRIVETSIGIAEKVIDKLGANTVEEFLNTIYRIKEIVDESCGGKLC